MRRSRVGALWSKSRRFRTSVVATAFTFGSLIGVIPSTAPPAEAGGPISAVGTLATAGGDTLSVSPQTVGDLMVLTVSANNAPPPTVAGVSGGGVSTWTLAKRYDDTANALADTEIWYGKVATTGSSTITVSMSGYSNATDLTAREFSAGSGVTWGVDTSGTNQKLGTPWNYPSLTAAGSGELYYGIAIRNNTGTLSGNGTAGFTYNTTGLHNGDLIAYDTGASGTLQPSGTNTSGDSYEDSVGVLFTASGGGGGGGGTISAVGTFATASGDTLSVSPQTAGDLMVLTVSANNGTPPTVNSVSGGGASTWSLAKRLDDTTNAYADTEIWYGKVATTGSSTITVSMSGYSNATDLTAREFSAGSGATWSVDTSGTNQKLGSPWNYPSLTAAGTGELYYGVAIRNNTGTLSGNGTTGFTYNTTSLGNGDLVAYDTSASGTLQPSGTNTSGGSYEDSVGVLFTASGGSGGGGGGGTWNCTAAAFQACSFSNDPGWDEYNNPWNNPAMPPNSYTLNANSHSSWDAIVNQANCPTSNCAVEGFESAQWNYANTAGTDTIAQITGMTSDFNQTMPTGNLNTNGFDAEAAYDIWLNNYGLEVMIWVDNQGQTPAGSSVGTMSSGGANYTVYDSSGHTFSFVISNNENSGTVNIQDFLNWLVSHNYTPSTSYMTQFNFGWEICSTNGQTDTFTMNNLTLNQSFS